MCCFLFISWAPSDSYNECAYISHGCFHGIWSYEVILEDLVNEPVTNMVKPKLFAYFSAHGTVCTGDFVIIIKHTDGRELWKCPHIFIELRVTVGWSMWLEFLEMLKRSHIAHKKYQVWMKVLDEETLFWWCNSKDNMFYLNELVLLWYVFVHVLQSMC